MKKRIYRAGSIKDIRLDVLKQRLGEGRVIVGVDVGKEVPFAVFMCGDGESVFTVKWKQHQQTPAFIGILKELGAGRVEVSMEPTGTYGDALRYQLQKSGFRVFKVSPKRTHDAREVFDGVPSSHDGKSAWLTARLHRDGLSTLWTRDPERKRALSAALRVMTMYDEQLGAGVNRLEGLLARHWPELTDYFALSSATLLALLQEYGSPQAVAAQPERAATLMRKVGSSMLSQKKIDGALESAGGTQGVPMTDAESRMLAIIAADTDRARKETRKAKQAVESFCDEYPPIRSMAPVIGRTTAAVLVNAVGDPRDYPSAKAYLKGFGLNLKERSSGKYKGQLGITKRGSGISRKYLFLAAWRLIQSDAIVKAWYAKRLTKNGGIKMKGLVAVMRKLVLGLWHAGRGNEFDSSLLFDTRRLTIPEIVAGPGILSRTVKTN